MRYTATLLAVLLGIFVLIQCQSTDDTSPSVRLAEGTESHLPYWNHGDSAQYVGMDQCRVCHTDKHDSFLRTGMGKSFGIATRYKSSGDFSGHPIVHDSINDFYYTPFWKRSALRILEYRVEGNDTVHQWEQPIEYIIGSGQHTNSHLFAVGNLLFQAPMTYYTQDGKWDLPPGYENGANSRFSRIIGLECMSCHNAMPTDFQMGSENEFHSLPGGIDCERCHGPGNLHINKITRGDITDTANEIDYSIVNPKKLSNELQFQICQRCHLQGNAVLAPNKSFFDFRPGMMLKDIMDVYLPRYTDSEESFIMASHVDRLKQSECFLQTDGKITCVTCHNPHVSVEETGRDQYNNSCRSCHQDYPKTHANTTDYHESNEDCSTCHMPSSSSIDIPHVSVHDHKIQIPGQEKQTESIREFITLVSVNNDAPSDRSRWVAYMQQYEKFGGEFFLLDSAATIAKGMDRNQYFNEWVQLKFLRGETIEIVQWATVETPNAILSKLNKPSYDNLHAWTAYRIGESFKAEKDVKNAVLFLEKSVELAPKHPDFRLQYAIALISDGREAEGMKELENVTNMNPNEEVAMSNLGYLYLAQGQTERAYKFLKRAVNLNPDYVQGGVNLAAYYLYLGQTENAREILAPLSAKYPENAQVAKAMQFLNSAQ
ncbi:MAG: hypothetical protein SchgKO_05060 [Schleiferiaceae bacterium]